MGHTFNILLSKFLTLKIIYCGIIVENYYCGQIFGETYFIDYSSLLVDTWPQIFKLVVSVN